MLKIESILCHTVYFIHNQMAAIQNENKIKFMVFKNILYFVIFNLKA